MPTPVEQSLPLEPEVRSRPPPKKTPASIRRGSYWGAYPRKEAVSSATARVNAAFG
jgi:hypothetical protein